MHYSIFSPQKQELVVRKAPTWSISTTHGLEKNEEEQKSVDISKWKREGERERRESSCSYDRKIGYIARADWLVIMGTGGLHYFISSVSLWVFLLEEERDRLTNWLWDWKHMLWSHRHNLIYYSLSWFHGMVNHAG